MAALPDTVDALGTLAEPAAATLLAQLAEHELLSVPYLPVPVGSLIGAGLGGLIEPLVDRGEALLADRLGAAPERRAWTGNGALGPEGARLLAGLGFGSVVVEAAPPDPGEDDDPDALVGAGPRPVEDGGALAGLVVDPTLSDELAEGDDHADAAHVALARILLSPITPAPDDDEARPVVLVRPGGLAADSVLAGLLALLDDPAAPVRVGGLDLVGSVVEEGPEPVERAAATEPDLGGIPGRVLASAGQLDSYQALIGAQSSRADDLRLQVATALATTTPAARRDAAHGHGGGGARHRLRQRAAQRRAQPQPDVAPGHAAGDGREREPVPGRRRHPHDQRPAPRSPTAGTSPSPSRPAMPCASTCRWRRWPRGRCPSRSRCGRRTTPSASMAASSTCVRPPSAGSGCSSRSARSSSSSSGGCAAGAARGTGASPDPGPAEGSMG